ncbi:hypothetical protein [Pseudoduganella sp. UC29_106]|uniref:hypothetical protein n=1 Tax=Pseudoduganella sp. UC29_106 TaxID=3374553 RepID=UPI0037568F46
MNRIYQSRRNDSILSEYVQRGISLMYVAGITEARRYLVARSVPQEVIDRVLSSTAQRRQLAHPFGVSSVNRTREESS